MIILGVNGFEDWSHDPAACILVDGRLLCFVEEERLCRRKHAPGQPPRQAAAACLKQARVAWHDVDCVAVGWDVPAVLRFAGESCDRRAVALRLLRSLGAPSDFSPDRVEFIAHHDAHAWSVVALCADRRALVVVADGQGEWASTSVYRYAGGDLVRLHSLGPEHSLGYFFEAASAYVGLGLNGAGKLMGLAAYAGEPTRRAFAEDPVKGYSTPVPGSHGAQVSEELDHAKSICDGFWTPYLQGAFPGLGGHAVEAPFSARDDLHLCDTAVTVAAFAQRSLEDAMLGILRVFLEDSDDAVGLAGGVALNCGMNGGVSRFLGGRSLFVQPASGDAGVALGAALSVARRRSDWPVDLGRFPWVGESLDLSTLTAQLRAAGLSWRRLSGVPERVAGMLEEGLVVGWVQGPAEVGPRALGARSILARADDLLVTERVNRRIKRRERWRPLAPAVLDEWGPTLFEGYRSSPFMLVAHRVSSGGHAHLMGTTHVDGSARPQGVVYGNAPPGYAELLRAIGGRASAPAVLDTSFNLAGEPMVYTVADSIRTFLESELDALVVDDVIVSRGGR